MECFLALKTVEYNIKIESICLHLVNIAAFLKKEIAVLQTATFVLFFNLSPCSGTLSAASGVSPSSSSRGWIWKVC